MKPIIALTFILLLSGCSTIRGNRRDGATRRNEDHNLLNT
jgi:uncharacterized protein YceK